MMIPNFLYPLKFSYPYYGRQFLLPPPTPSPPPLPAPPLAAMMMLLNPKALSPFSFSLCISWLGGDITEKRDRPVSFNISVGPS